MRRWDMSGLRLLQAWIGTVSRSADVGEWLRIVLLQLEKLLQVINHGTLKSLDIGLDIFALS